MLGSPGRVVHEEENKNGRKESEARSDSKTPSDLVKRIVSKRVKKFDTTSTLMEPHQEQNRDHCQTEWLGVEDANSQTKFFIHSPM